MAIARANALNGGKPQGRAQGNIRHFLHFAVRKVMWHCDMRCYPRGTLSYRNAIMFTRIIDAVAFFRDAAVIARRRQPEELKRYFEMQ